MPQAVVIGTGSYLPDKRLTNEDLERYTFSSSSGETYHEKAVNILERTGIRERRMSENMATSDLAAEAARRAIQAAKIPLDEIDLLLFSSSTPDYKIPKCAPSVASKIGLHGIAAYDFGKDCSGCLEALEAAAYYIAAGRHETVLVVAAERCSTFVNYNNKATSVIFGDGAAAVVLQRKEDTDRGFLHCVAGSQGDLADRLYVPVGGSTRPFEEGVEQADTKLKMDGKAVFDYASQVFAMGVERLFAEKGMSAGDLDILIPHQSNLRIIESAAKSLDLPMDKVMINVDRYGNTAGASTLIALDEAVRSGKLHPGDITCLVAYGAGFSWIASLFRW